jgi:hypothetical protein
VSNFGKFLRDLGLLHDCTITLFTLKPEARSIEFEIKDLYFNFEGLPEYGGPKPGRIVLEGIECVEIEIHELMRDMRIFEFSLVKEGADSSIVSVSLGLYGKIEVTYRRALFPDDVK